MLLAEWIAANANGADRNGTHERAEDENAAQRNPKERLSMKTIRIKLKGVSPYLMCKFKETEESPKSTRKMLVVRGTPREEAAKVLYQDEQGKFFFPSSCIERMIRSVAGNHKLKGSRKSARYVVPAAVRVVEDVVILLNGDGKSEAKDWEIDSRPVVIQSTKGRVMRHRPRFENWSVCFTLKINDELLEESFVHELINEAGDQNGLGDFRIERGGRFGAFQVIEWTSI